MFENISLRSVASYSDQTSTEFNPKKINLIYGHNGTGKSTIARFLQSPTDPQYVSCNSTSNFAQSEVFVYNEIFIDKNFLETTPGVFTLSEANQVAETAITEAQTELSNSTEIIAIKSAASFTVQRKIEPLEIALKEKIWTERTKFDRTPLEYCLSGFKHSKDAFLQHVIDADTPLSDKDSFESLMLDAKELTSQEGVGIKRELIRLEFDFTSHETNSLLTEIIVGSDDSYLSQLITKLSNSDWVKLGIPLLDNSESKCPFCQQTLPAAFEHEVNNLFNDVYNQKIDQLHQIKVDYVDFSNALIAKLDLDVFGDEYVLSDLSFQLAKSDLVNVLGDNLKLIEQKIVNPSKATSLFLTSEKIELINNSIIAISERIREFNHKVANRKANLEVITRKFWALIKKKYQSDIDGNKVAIEAIKTEFTLIRDEIALYQNLNKGYERIIAENRAMTTNIDISVANINSYMTLLGIEGFSIERESPTSNFYHLVRNNTKKIYKTLSEGEKTLITFLYFIETCKGSANQVSAVMYANRVVVIDDPVTSLSHNYVYDIAALIQHKIIESGFRQVFVLTHSLFFLHEMIKLKDYCADKPLKQNYLILRITKNQTSNISVITEKEIMNDYQSYWQVIKDCKAGRASPLILPNVMRNILEYYFAFVHQKTALVKILTDLGSEEIEFKPLARYINRQSHSDNMNIHDFGQIDPARYLSAFEKIFTKASFKEHYDLMMTETVP